MLRAAMPVCGSTIGNNDELYDSFAMEAYLALEPSSFPHPGSRSLSQVLSADRVEQMTKTYNDIDVLISRCASEITDSQCSLSRVMM
ncbi:hypothetical protein JZ751_009212 [Albula glossodonta]|uniref:Uncharacterized protein n=1 Tax=Albula glossodonta TaxID=121402 RepID=A0A8T2N0M1_9TELE|nr:hypothetical protein JZ751_009212 [Albula glossodonta]